MGDLSAQTLDTWANASGNSAINLLSMTGAEAAAADETDCCWHRESESEDGQLPWRHESRVGCRRATRRIRRMCGVIQFELGFGR